MSSSVINTDKKSETKSDSLDLGSISSIIKIILSAFSVPDTPITPLPPPLLLAGSVTLPGLSTSNVASRIISRQSEAGLIVGDVYEDGDNTAEKMELIRIEEILNALQTEAKIEIAIPPGTPISAFGISNVPGAPIYVQGITTAPATGTGVVR